MVQVGYRGDAVYRRLDLSTFAQHGLDGAQARVEDVVIVGAGGKVSFFVEALFQDLSIPSSILCAYEATDEPSADLIGRELFTYGASEVPGKLVGFVDQAGRCVEQQGRGWTVAMGLKRVTSRASLMS